MTFLVGWRHRPRCKFMEGVAVKRQCPRRSSYLIDKDPVCETHAGAIALQYVMEMQR